MVFKNLLVPYDQSDPSKRALQKAKEMVLDSPGTKLHIIHVTSVPESPYFMGYGPDALGMEYPSMSLEEFKEVQGKLLKQASDEVHASTKTVLEGIEAAVTVEILHGAQTTGGIVSYAEEHNCDLIIMGCRGLGALRGVIGSVSYGVLRSAPMPVLIVK